MIKFETITYKNILSVGQAPITIDLCSHRLTSLNGPSGSGKSLFLDALSFVLFGRAFRDINKTDLINSINEKALLVEVTFSIGTDRYKVARGMKPTIFEISLNGTVLDQQSHVKEQQKVLEDQILKMNWKMFTHVVMLGAANYTPFMRLKPNDRKKMVENILGIDVFSTMNAIVKTKISDETILYKSIVEKKDVLSGQVEFLKQQQKSFQEKVQDEIHSLTQKLIGVRDRKKNLDAEIHHSETEIKEFENSFDPKIEIPEFREIFTDTFEETFNHAFTDTFEEVDQSAYDPSDLLNQRAQKLAEIKSLNQRLEQARETVQFYCNNDLCPTCAQGIGQEFKSNALHNLNLDITATQEAIKASEADISRIREEAEQLQSRKKKYLQDLSDFNSRKQVFEDKRTAFETRRRQFEERLREFENRRREHESQLKTVELMIEEKRKVFDAQVDVLKMKLSEKKGQVSGIVAEAKLILENIEEKKSKPLLDNSDEISRITSQINELNGQTEQCARNLKLLREAQTIIKDDGVKSEILKRYVPTLNKYINKYLTKMGMFVSFELDQEFNDTIKSRHRDTLSYANYSEGERQRIDLAVLLAWRHLAQSQAAVNTNLLILDEVLDSYLDQTTTETILNLMKGEDFQLFNIVVISHKEGLSEHFDRTLRFQKKSNFTAVTLDR